MAMKPIYVNISKNTKNKNKVAFFNKKMIIKNNKEEDEYGKSLVILIPIIGGILKNLVNLLKF